MRKATNNYIVDVIIGLAFIGSAFSGLAFLLPYEWLPVSSEGIAVLLGLSLPVWSTIHTISSVLMIAGVGLHLVLHWQWIVAMTKKLLGINQPAQRKSPVVATASKTNDVSRRQFLTLGGGAALGMLLGWNFKSLFTGDTADSEITLSGVSQAETVNPTVEQPVTESSESSAGQTNRNAYGNSSTTASAEAIEEVVTPEPTEAASVVVEPTATVEPEKTQAVVNTFTCPKGLVNDPYPGRCRHYTDENGNGICDYSEV